MMGQQISLEDALDAFRKQYGQAMDENVLLRAQVAALQRRVDELEQAGGQQAPAGGPDLAAQPPFPDEDRR